MKAKRTLKTANRTQAGNDQRTRTKAAREKPNRNPGRATSDTARGKQKDHPPTTAETIKADYKTILRTGKASKAGRTTTGKLYPKQETQTRRNHAQKGKPTKGEPRPKEPNGKAASDQPPKICTRTKAERTHKSRF